MVHPPIAKPEDLRGKTLAVTRFGSITDLLIRPVLKNGGLEPQKDVKLIQIGRMPDIATAIAQTSVDGGVISFPTSVQAEKNEYQNDAGFCGVRFRFAGNHGGRKPALQQKQPRYGVEVSQGLYRGDPELFADRELGIRALRRHGGINDREMLASTYDLFTSRYLKKIPYVNAKGVENSLSLIAESNPRAKNRKPQEFMDTSFMEELESTGFISSVWK